MESPYKFSEEEGSSGSLYVAAPITPAEGALVPIHGDDIFMGQGEGEGRREESIDLNDIVPVILMEGFQTYLGNVVVKVC